MTTDEGATVAGMTKVRLQSPAEGVRVIRLADPSHRNALDRRLRQELTTASASVAADPDARVLVVTGDGPAFCSGADVVDTFDGISARPIEEVRDFLLRFYESFLGIRDLPIPTIAAVRGAAIGAGLNLAFSCDVRLAAPDATFGMTFSRIGLHPGGGASFFLARTLGPQRALRLLLDGATLDAPAALHGGIIDEIVEDPEASAIAIATRWARLEPALARAIKRSVQLAVGSGFDATLEFESWAQAASARRPSIQEIVEHHRAKRG